MNTCPCCGWPTGNRSFAPRNGGPTGLSVAPCVADRYDATDVTQAMARLDEMQPIYAAVAQLERNRP